MKGRIEPSSIVLVVAQRDSLHFSATEKRILAVASFLASSPERDSRMSQLSRTCPQLLCKSSRQMCPTTLHCPNSPESEPKLVLGAPKTRRGQHCMKVEFTDNDSPRVAPDSEAQICTPT